MEKETGRHEPPKREKKQMGVPAMVALDLLVIIVGLNVFALFHHVLPTYWHKEVEPVVLAEPSVSLAAPVETLPVETEAPEALATPEPTHRPGQWGDKFADHFTDGEVIQTEDSYRSANISVTVTTVQEEKLVYHIADVYISDLKYLRCAFGNDSFGSSAQPADLARDHKAVVAISGDHCFGRWEGIVIRNGLLYRDTRFEDVCILLNDGRMLTVPNQELDMEELLEMAPWQVWSFGPRLLEDGKAREKIDSTVWRANPRSAIGYVEPGHYFFVQVDGRGGFDSEGMNLDDLAKIFEELGCETAYNLDGGRTASMYWLEDLISYPYGRPVYDIIYITEEPELTEEAP